MFNTRKFSLPRGNRILSLLSVCESQVAGKRELLKEATVPGTMIPDVKQRLGAVGLIDKLRGKEAIKIPGGDAYINKSNVEVPGVDGMPRQDPGFVIVGSDVEKLYPSLCPLEAARMSRIAILESKIEIKDINLLRAIRYLFVVGGIELFERAGIIRLVPKWLGKRPDLISLGGKKTNSDPRNIRRRSFNCLSIKYSITNSSN